MHLSLQILGSGTSTGIPIPGCECRVCTSGNPKNNRARTSAVIRAEDGTSILIDSSTDLRSQALQWGLKRVHAVLYSHPHADHILGLDDLRTFNFIQKELIPCYGTPETLGEIERIFSYVFHPDALYEGGLLPQLSLNPITHLKTFEVCGIPLMPFPLGHGRMTVTGFKVGELAYATDCKVIPAESQELLRDIPYLILDGLRYEAHRSHMTIPEAVAATQALGAKKTYLIHMTHSVDHDEVNAKLPPGIELAYDGLVIPFQL